MNLLIDAGNTRVKWCLANQHQLGPIHSVNHPDVPELAALWSKLTVTQAYGCNVAGHTVAEQLSTCSPLPITWLRPSSRAGGLTNAYLDPSRLGADRWAAAIGAYHLNQQQACVVAHAGTALTIDCVDQAGHFLGGTITPGLHLMRDSLARGTAQLPYAEGHWQTHPNNTVDAIYSGCLNALADSIYGNLLRFEAEQHRPVNVFLGGGDATIIASRLPRRPTIVDNLVLTGLAYMAEEESSW